MSVVASDASVRIVLQAEFPLKLSKLALQSDVVCPTVYNIPLLVQVVKRRKIYTYAEQKPE